MIKRLCIVGVGLIGGSLARALRAVDAVEHVIGTSRREQHLAEAEALGVIDSYDTDLLKAVTGADMVVVCVPLGVMTDVFTQMASALADDTIVTDVGSAKLSVIEAARDTLGSAFTRFVPGHPIAGTEKSGVSASFAELYLKRRVILTPVPQTDSMALDKVKQMWRAAGAVVQSMSPEHHDTVLAATSHLPHVLAYTLVDTLARMSDRDEIFAYAAGGFRDFTRIASSDPVMWRDICQANREALLNMIDRYQADLGQIRSLIEAQDWQGLQDVFINAKAARDRYSES